MPCAISPRVMTGRERPASFVKSRRKTAPPPQACQAPLQALGSRNGATLGGPYLCLREAQQPAPCCGSCGHSPPKLVGSGLALRTVALVFDPGSHGIFGQFRIMLLPKLTHMSPEDIPPIAF